MGVRLVGEIGVVAGTLAPARALIWRVIPVPYAATFVGAIVAGVACAWVVRAVYTRPGLVRAAIQHHGDEIEKLLLRAIETSVPVMVTLEHKKVYAGFVLSMPTLSDRDRYTKLFPVKSGFRDNSDQRIHWTTDYAMVLEQLALEIESEASGTGSGAPSRHGPTQDWQVFGTVLPIDRITSATLFDEGIYQRFSDGEAAEG